MANNVHLVDYKLDQFVFGMYHSDLSSVQCLYALLSAIERYVVLCSLYLSDTFFQL